MYISTARIHVSSHPVGRDNILKILEFHDKIFGLVKNLPYLQCLFPVTSGEIQVIGFRISYAKIAQSVDKVPFLLVEFIRVVDDPPDVEVDDGLAAGGGVRRRSLRGRGSRHRSRSISIAGRWRRRFAGCSSIRGSGGPGSTSRGCWIKSVKCKAESVKHCKALHFFYRAVEIVSISISAR